MPVAGKWTNQPVTSKTPNLPYAPIQITRNGIVQNGSAIQAIDYDPATRILTVTPLDPPWPVTDNVGVWWASDPALSLKLLY